MIKFACRCSHTFVVEDDQAGSSLQCPACGLLVDVPTLSDLPNLASDGTYTLSDLDHRPEPNRLNRLYRSFTRDHVDPTTGEEIDLRISREEVRDARTADPLHPKDEPRSVRPKYDPVTGELVRPLDVAGAAGDASPANPAAIPMARATVGYATAYTRTVPGFWTIAVELLMPVNVVVMFFVAMAYLVGQFALATVFLFFVDLPVAALLLSHYGNVIEDTGPEARDEIPRPLRYLAVGEDLWWPFFRMFSAVAVCYAPLVAVLVYRLPLPLAGMAALAGTIFLPAVMLTAATSGSILNLRPDRVVGVIGILGSRYAVAVLLWVVALTLHLWTWLGVVLIADAAKLNMIDARWSKLNHWAAVYPLIAVAIYLMHFYCWWLGTLYRRHQHEFPWVLQRHVPDPNRQKAPTRLTPYGPVRVAGQQQQGPRVARRA
jgi:hypothetical protein